LYTSSAEIEIQATPKQVFTILSDLSHLPEWYVPAQAIHPHQETPLKPGWQFYLMVRTLGGIVLRALGTVKTYDPDNYHITWHGQALGIQGDSQWQVQIQNNKTLVTHTFTGTGWMLALSHFLGRHHQTLAMRLTNLKRLVETLVETKEL